MKSGPVPTTSVVGHGPYYRIIFAFAVDPMQDEWLIAHIRRMNNPLICHWRMFEAGVEEEKHDFETDPKNL